jgi:hypothetical protein
VSAIEIILVLVGITGLVFAIIAAAQALERRAARKLATPLLGRPCPFCGSSFRQDAIRGARLEHPFDGSNYASVVCLDCSKRWGLLDDRLMEQPL